MKLLRASAARLKPLSFKNGALSVLTLNLNTPLVFVGPSDDPWVPLNADWCAIGGDFTVAGRQVERHRTGNGSSRERTFA